MLRATAITILLLLVSSCGNHDPQVSRRPLDESSFFEDGSASRIPPSGTVRRIEEIPLGENGYPQNFKLSKETLRQGRVLFDKQCSVCHGHTGRGDGIVTRRGLVPPPSLHSKEHSVMTPEELVEVMTEGRGRMPSMVRRLVESDRWKVAAYVKALQLSRKMPVNKLSQRDKEKLHAP